MPDSRRRPPAGAGRPGSRGGPAPRRTTPRAAPGAAERSGAAGAQGATTAKRRRFTGRMAILGVVLAVLVISYASSMRAYLQQKSQIDGLRAEIASSTTDIASLQKQKSRFAEDSYNIEQARARLGWVLPGETAYEVIDRDGKPLESSDRLADPDQVIHSTPASWWSKQYDSLRKADHPPKKPQKPVGSIPSTSR